MNQTKKKAPLIAAAVVAVLLLLMLYAGIAGRQPVRVDSGYRVVMGTFSRVVVVAPSEKAGRACLREAFEVQRRIESRMSYHRSDSELNEVNRRAAEGPVPVSALTFDVLQKAIYFSELSAGAFDVTVGPLVDLWRAAADANAPPSDAELAAARSKIGYDKLILDEGQMTVEFAVAGMKLDLGGIAKGFAIDKTLETLRQGGALGGMVDIGGDIRCFGRPPEGQDYWRIGLQEPTKVSDDPVPGRALLVLQLSDGAVTTSGDYRRFTEVGGQRQSHIMDVATGRGAARLASVTVIAPDATTADALATAVSVLGVEKGLALIDTLSEVEAVLIPHEAGAELVFSQGAAAYVR